MILSRLPVKSIFRFRCVSKSWCSLLSSKYFIESHLQISIKNTNFANNIIIIEDVYPSTSLSTLKFFSLDVVLYRLRSKAVTFDYTFPSIRSTISSIVLVGCCNGICCALIKGKIEKGFFLWNPSTRKSTMKFPKIEMYSSCTLCGFGFDEISDDYKEDGRFSYKGHGLCFCGYPWGFANGKLHWLMIHDYDNDVNNVELDVVCFDLGTEAYGGVVDKPFYLDRRFDPSIGVLGGCLCVVSGTRERLHEIWVLKKNGFEEYWDKVMTLPYHVSWRVMGPKPLCITPDGVIMFVLEQGIYMYDPKNDSAPRLINYALLSQFSVCVQSLVFPFCDDDEENQKQWYERLVGGNLMDEHTITIQNMRSRLGEENPSDKQPTARSPFQQPRSSKRNDAVLRG